MSGFAGTDFLDESTLTQGVIGRRIAGWLFDAILMGLISGLLWTGLVLLGFLTFGLGWWLLGGLWVVPIAYTTLFVSSTMQATPGQAAAGLVVVRDDDLERPTPAQALVYAAGYWITLALSASLLFLLAFFSRRKRCLHDIVAGVLVARRGGVPALPADWSWRRGPDDP